MGETTGIAWTDHTFNPWWGCERVSDGCQHCYAETFAKRYGHEVWGKNNGRRFFGEKHWQEPRRWNRLAEFDGVRRRTFCASMADVFEDRDELVDERGRLWILIAETPWLDWQLLTKRPQNVRGMVPAEWLKDWPGNVWLGTTVEHQAGAEARIGELLATPASVRFLSCEPLLGPIDFDACTAWHPSVNDIFLEGIHWVIVGGESGNNYRPLDLEHARSIRDQCERAGVAFFFKQVGGRTPTAGGDLLDGVRYKMFPR
jgi:protein gp37